MDQEAVQVVITLNGADEKDVDRSGRQLCTDLSGLDGLADAKPRHGEVLQGSKGSLTSFGDLVVAVLSSAGAASLISAVGSCLSADRSLNIEMTVNGNTLKLNRLNREERARWEDWFKTQTGMRFDR